MTEQRRQVDCSGVTVGMGGPQTRVWRISDCVGAVGMVSISDCVAVGMASIKKELRR